MSTAEVRFQTLTPQAGFKALNQFEESEVRASAPPELGDIAVANAMWRKAHPGWRDQKAQDLRPVYFILAPHSGLVKIGVAANPLRRLRALRTLSPEALELIALTTMGGRPLELQLHERFRELRHHGEWFYATPELLGVIAEATA